MSRAVEVLKKENRITASPRRGIHIVDADSGAPQPETGANGNVEEEGYCFVPKWHRVRDLLTDDMLRGHFGPGERLPPLKVLCWRYGTSYLTLRQAISSLTATGKLVAYKKGYAVPTARVRRSTGTIVVIAFSRLVHDLVAYIPFLSDFFSLLERQQRSFAYKIEMLSYFDFFDAHHPTYSLDDVERRFTVIGYIVAFGTMKTWAAENLVTMMRATRRPVAFLDALSYYQTHRPVDYPARFRFFCLANESRNAGRDVGNFLFGRGHRKVAYFTPAPEAAWSRMRMEGIAGALVPREGEEPVCQYSVDLGAMVGAMRKEAAFARLYRSFTGMGDEEVFHFRSEHLMPLLEDCILLKAAEPLFQQALRDEHTTAWVCATDQTALLAYFFLRRNNVTMPDTVSVVGFDNIRATFMYGISTYDFNTVGAGQAILKYLLSPAHIRLHEGLDHVDIPGLVVERRTT